MIWIDKNVDNNENKKYKEKMINNFKYKFYGFDSVSKAIDTLKKIEFVETYIICSGKAYIKFIKKFIENINEFMICPKIIIFTSDKKKYLEMNQNNNDLFLNHSFYNSGGIEDNYEEIEKLLKNKNSFNKNNSNGNDELNSYIKLNKNNGKSANFNIEYISHKNYLIVPIYLSFYIRKPEKKQIQQFNKYMLEKYSNKIEIVNLFKQINDMKEILNEIISKYWAKSIYFTKSFL